MLFRSTHAYRITAEELPNAFRHSGASHIAVSLSAERDAASIVVSDDGSGLPDEARPGSHGLPSMRNRAETIDAELDLSRGEGERGTVVTLNVPLTIPSEAPA